MACICGSRYCESRSRAISRKFNPKSSIRVPSGTAKSAVIRTKSSCSASLSGRNTTSSLNPKPVRPRSSTAEAMLVNTLSVRKIVARCSNSLGTCDWMPGFQGPNSLLGSIEIELGTVRIHSQARHLAALQLLLYVQPIIDGEQIGIFLPKTASRKVVLELHAVFELFRKKDHTLLEVPAGHAVLARLTIRIAANLHVRQFLDGVIIEQKYAAIAADAVIPGIQILVEDVGGGIVANAMAQARNHGARLALTGARQVHRQRDYFQLHDQ